MAARWFLGLAEAGLFPGVNYYLSCWYRRSEFGIRAVSFHLFYLLPSYVSLHLAEVIQFQICDHEAFSAISSQHLTAKSGVSSTHSVTISLLSVLTLLQAIFFSAAAVAGSFGGLLAAAINKMDGLGGKPGWAWIFILEGIVTVIFGFFSFWMVHDFPDEATFLSDVDRIRVIRRLKADQQASANSEQFQMAYLYAGLKDYKMWLGMVIYMGCDMPLYAFSLFLPTIIKDMGYSSTRAQLLTVPPYAAAAILTVTIGYIADRTRQRGLCNICVVLIGIAG